MAGEAVRKKLSLQAAIKNAKSAAYLLRVTGEKQLRAPSEACWQHASHWLSPSPLYREESAERK